MPHPCQRREGSQVLELKRITVRFGAGGVPVVEDVCLTVEEGTKTVIIGETGSGKSVLILALLKLLPSTAIVTGEVIYRGIDVFSLSERELAALRGAKIAYVPQGSGNSLNPLHPIGKQVGESMAAGNLLPAKELRARVLALLKSFHLGDEERLVKQYPHTLSGGMRQRVLVAMGVAPGAAVILADEPTKGLDAARVRLVEDSFMRLEGKSLICVTHDISFARKIGEYVSVMYAAQQVEIASAEDFFKRPLHPYAQAMLAAMPENGLKAIVGFAPPHNEYLNHGCRFYVRCPNKTNRCLTPPPLVEIENRKVRCWIYAD